jgi:hypothetical protein
MALKAAKKVLYSYYESKISSDSIFARYWLRCGFFVLEKNSPDGLGDFPNALGNFPSRRIGFSGFGSRSSYPSGLFPASSVRTIPNRNLKSDNDNFFTEINPGREVIP